MSSWAEQLHARNTFFQKGKYFQSRTKATPKLHSQGKIYRGNTNSGKGRSGRPGPAAVGYKMELLNTHYLTSFELNWLLSPLGSSYRPSDRPRAISFYVWYFPVYEQFFEHFSPRSKLCSGGAVFSSLPPLASLPPSLVRSVSCFLSCNVD